MILSSSRKSAGVKSKSCSQIFATFKQILNAYPPPPKLTYRHTKYKNMLMQTYTVLNTQPTHRHTVCAEPYFYRNTHTKQTHTVLRKNSGIFPY